jgi:DTW domain-containing protein YfiP
MASLCLTNSELHVGLDWSRSAEVARALADPARPPILLYPGPGARDIVSEPPPGPVTLVVIDGTWAQTKKMLRLNPSLAALPRYAFVPAQPSEYRIRKEPDDASVATIEAIVHALSALEDGNNGQTGSRPGFDGTSGVEKMLEPFRAMIDFQIACESQFHGARVRHARRKARPRRHGVPRVIGDGLANLVCVAGEANAWPYGARVAPDELVHWTAFRPATGDQLSLIVAPEGDLAPGTVRHTGIDEGTLRAGRSLDDVFSAWRSFVRDDDVVCSWGRYEPDLFESAGGWLPQASLDLRRVARDVNRGRTGTLGEYRDRVYPHECSDDALLAVPGRAGRKLRAIRDVVAHFTSLSGTH